MNKFKQLTSYNESQERRKVLNTFYKHGGYKSTHKTASINAPFRISNEFSFQNYSSAGGNI
jgi:hypothetical protein